MIIILLVFIGIIFEGLGVWFLLFEEGYYKLLFFIFHGLASVIVTVPFYILLPEKYKHPKKFSYTALFLAVFIAPVLGFFFTTAVLILLRNQKKLPYIAMETVPVFHLIDEKIQTKKRTFGESSIREFVLRKNIPSTLRLRAFMFLTEMRSPESVKLLRHGLTDNNDEIRLLAFSYIDKVEKKLSEQIHFYIEKLKEDLDKKEKGRIYTELAKLYWEIIYIGMADKEITEFYLSESERYALLAKENQDNPYIDLLLGRIYLKKRELDKSLNHLKKALESNIPEFKVAPYLAEIFFLKGEFNKIKEIMNKYSYLKYDPSFYPVAVLWEEG
ncbi:tetratricopeptide repeat protein [Persephonella sp.]